MEAQPAASATSQIDVQRQGDAQDLILQLNAHLPGLAKKLTPHHTGLSLRIRFKADGSGIHQQAGIVGSYIHPQVFRRGDGTEA